MREVHFIDLGKEPWTPRFIEEDEAERKRLMGLSADEVLASVPEKVSDPAWSPHFGFGGVDVEQ